MTKPKNNSIELLPAEKQKEIIGTGLIGYVYCPYKNLVSLLGKPNAENDGYKIDAEWAIEMNGKILTIYNYKDGHNYNGKRNGLPVSKITEWHIGSKEDVTSEMKALQKILNPKKKCKLA
jgi:hypothetical protein